MSIYPKSTVMSAINSKFFWKIDEGTHWDAFQNNVKEMFDEEWYKTSNDVNQLWNVWKNKVNCAAKSVIKKAPRVKNYKNIWDKDLDRMLKSRREAKHSYSAFTINIDHVIANLAKIFLIYIVNVKRYCNQT